jgi:hypothetical protein
VVQATKILIPDEKFGDFFIFTPTFVGCILFSDSVEYPWVKLILKKGDVF